MIRFRAEEADQAFAAHRALLLAEKNDPALATNTYWQALRDAAFARFHAAFERA